MKKKKKEMIFEETNKEVQGNIKEWKEKRK